MKSHCHHCSFRVMPAINITEVFMGSINNSAEKSLQNLMASCIPRALNSSKICACTQRGYAISSDGKDGLHQTRSLQKEMPLFGGRDKQQLQLQSYKDEMNLTEI